MSSQPPEPLFRAVDAVVVRAPSLEGPVAPGRLSDSRRAP